MPHRNSRSGWGCLLYVRSTLDFIVVFPSGANRKLLYRQTGHGYTSFGIYETHKRKIYHDASYEYTLLPDGAVLQVQHYSFRYSASFEGLFSTVDPIFMPNKKLCYRKVIAGGNALKKKEVHSEFHERQRPGEKQ